MGVLSAIAERLPGGDRSPFAILCGTSAGAINAASVAAGARDMPGAVRRLADVWSHLTLSDIYRTGAPHLARACWRAVRPLVPIPDARGPFALLDNTPLARLLAREIPFEAIPGNVAAGALEALAITASSYRSGMSVSFCAANPSVPLWQRSQRVGVPAEVGVAHVMASSAIPLVFPPVEIDGEFFGDGAVRQIAPTAPALHLGADRVLVVGSARNASGAAEGTSAGPPSLAQIGGHLLAGIFTDALGTDIEKVRLVNVAVRQIPPERLARSPMPLRDVMLLVVTPSVPLERLAARHVDRLPRTLRGLLGAGSGSSLLSYLLFDSAFCSELIELGYRDGLARATELTAFLEP